MSVQYSIAALMYFPKPVLELYVFESEFRSVSGLGIIDIPVLHDSKNFKLTYVSK